MLSKKQQVLFIILQCSIAGSLSWRPFEFSYNNVTILNEDQKIILSTVEIVKNSKGTTFINISFRIREQIQYVLCNVLCKNAPKDHTRPFFVNTTFDVCATFKKTVLPPFAAGLYRSLSNRTDMPLHCPIDLGLYNMTKVGDVEDEFPPYIPFNVYNIYLRFLVSTPTTTRMQEAIKIVVNMKVTPKAAPRPTKLNRNRG